MISVGAADFFILNYTLFDMIQAEIELFDICLKFKITTGKLV